MFDAQWEKMSDQERNLYEAMAQVFYDEDIIFSNQDIADLAIKMVKKKEEFGKLLK